jgi:hypothetical protein
MKMKKKGRNDKKERKEKEERFYFLKEKND